MARPGESLKNNNAEIWRETHLSRASEGPKRTGSSNPFRSTDESVRTTAPVAFLNQLRHPYLRGSAYGGHCTSTNGGLSTEMGRAGFIDNLRETLHLWGATLFAPSRDTGSRAF